MARNVIVKFNGISNEHAHARQHRDLTAGKEYIAFMPDHGMTDYNGMMVRFSDELWIPFDDALDNVVTRMSFGFEIVADA